MTSDQAFQGLMSALLGFKVCKSLFLLELRRLSGYFVPLLHDVVLEPTQQVLSYIFCFQCYVSEVPTSPSCHGWIIHTDRVCFEIVDDVGSHLHQACIHLDKGCFEPWGQWEQIVQPLVVRQAQAAIGQCFREYLGDSVRSRDQLLNVRFMPTPSKTERLGLTSITIRRLPQAKHPIPWGTT